LTANFTNSAGYPRPFSHPPHNLDGPHCSFVDAEALFETVRNDIDATIANTGQRDDAAQQLVVSILANLEPLQQAGVDSDWARQLTALAVSRAIEKMLATLAKDQYKRYHGEKPTKDQLAAAIDQLRGSGLAQAIADIKSMVGKNGCHPGNAAPGISPALVANIVDIEGTIQSDLDSTGYTDPNLKRDVRIWSGEAAIGLTSALINGTNECQAVDALVTQITNTFGDAEPALAGQVISDLSTLTGRDLSRCQ
jgi:hypothetical protein